jgi:hypothetical protein
MIGDWTQWQKEKAKAREVKQESHVTIVVSLGIMPEIVGPLLKVRVAKEGRRVKEEIEDPMQAKVEAMQEKGSIQEKD